METRTRNASWLLVLTLAISLYPSALVLALPTNAPVAVTHSVTTDLNLNLMSGDTNLFNQNAKLLTNALNHAGYAPGGGGAARTYLY